MIKRPPDAVFVIAAVMMLIALAPVPYGYYQLLRLVASVAAGWVAAFCWTSGKQGWAIAFGLILLLFNPIIRISLERDIWSVLNLVTAAIFLVALFSTRDHGGRHNINERQ